MNDKICTTCILDTTVQDIWFDETGECKYCKIHHEMDKQFPLNSTSSSRLQKLVEKIKNKSKNKPFDCVVGVSGGRDSTYTLLTAVKLGLRPLAVHFDNGWNTEISVRNIENAVNKLNVTLHTVVADWEEFKDLQLAFLKASVPDADVPTDFAIYSVLYDVAAKEGIPYILNGHSFRTEGTSPISWTYMDSRYIRAVHKKFGSGKIYSFPLMTITGLLYYLFAKRIKEVRLMELIDYKKNEVDETLKHELSWEYYGGHHHENTFTKFFQSYYLPQKFNIDKRKTELSALVRSNQLTRSEALTIIEENAYEYDNRVIDYAINKLGLTSAEFDEIMATDNQSHSDYPTLLKTIRMAKHPIRLATKLKLLPYILYLKYAN